MRKFSFAVPLFALCITIGVNAVAATGDNSVQLVGNNAIQAFVGSDVNGITATWNNTTTTLGDFGVIGGTTLEISYNSGAQVAVDFTGVEVNRVTVVVSGTQSFPIVDVPIKSGKKTQVLPAGSGVIYINVTPVDPGFQALSDAFTGITNSTPAQLQAALNALATSLNLPATVGQPGGTKVSDMQNSVTNLTGLINQYKTLVSGAPGSTGPNPSDLQTLLTTLQSYITAIKNANNGGSSDPAALQALLNVLTALQNALKQQGVTPDANGVATLVAQLNAALAQLAAFQNFLDSLTGHTGSTTTEVTQLFITTVTSAKPLFKATATDVDNTGKALIVNALYYRQDSGAVVQLSQPTTANFVTDDEAVGGVTTRLLKVTAKDNIVLLKPMRFINAIATGRSLTFKKASSQNAKGVFRPYPVLAGKYIVLPQL